MEKIIKHLKENWVRHGFETLVVVVGVLIAFTLNNWNEQRKNEKEEQLILVGLKDEFEANLNAVRNSLIRNRNTIAASHELINLIRSNELNIHLDLIDSLIIEQSLFSSFDAHTGFSDEIINSGKLSILRDQELKIQLTQWSSILQDTEEDIKFRSDFYSNVLTPFLTKYFPLANGDIYLKKSLYFDMHTINHSEKSHFSLKLKEIDLMEFENVIWQHKFQNDFVVNNDLSIENFVERTLVMINKNIE